MRLIARILLVLALTIPLGWSLDGWSLDKAEAHHSRWIPQGNSAQCIEAGSAYYGGIKWVFGYHHSGWIHHTKMYRLSDGKYLGIAHVGCTRH